MAGLAPEPTGRCDARVWLVAVVAGELGWLALRGQLVGVWAWVPVGGVLVGHARLVARERRSPSLSSPAVLMATVLVAAGAVAIAPSGSRDLYQYAFYGRMAHHFGADPYTTPPDAFRGDPLYAAIAPGWHAARSVYGPVFTWSSSWGAIWFGASALRARLWFQGIAAISMVASTRLVLRRGGTVAALSVGLSPVVVAAVNGGHNDVVVGALVLVGVSCALDGRSVASAAVLAVAACTKASALPMVLAVAVVAWRRGARRELTHATLTWLGVSVALYALGGGTHLLGPLGAVGGRTSRASPWALLERAAGSTAVGAAVVSVSALLAGGLVVVAAWRWCRHGLVAATVTAGAVACFAAPYVLAWYPASVVPVGGLRPSSRASRLLSVGSSALLAAYVVPAGQPPASVPLAPLAAVACGLVLSVLVLLLVGHRCPPRIGVRLATRSRR